MLTTMPCHFPKLCYVNSLSVGKKTLIVELGESQPEILVFSSTGMTSSTTELACGSLPFRSSLPESWWAVRRTWQQPEVRMKKPETETDASFEICGDADRAETVCRQIIRRIRWTDEVCRLIRRQIGEVRRRPMQLLSGQQVLFRCRQKSSTKTENLLKVM